MSLGDVSLACASALVDALVAGGVRHACLSPGSRSTPLALALAREERVRVHVHLDERAGAFFALGVAKATGEPVAVACTSGTATAELFPAVVEAERSRTPLVLLTADRPPRLRGTGANQTIDQEELYGRYARAYLEPPVPATDADATAWWELGLDAVRAARAPLPGPVQVDCPFEEPLVPERARAGRSSPSTASFASYGTRPETLAPDVRAFFDTYAGRRGVVTIGSLRPPTTLSVLSLGPLLGWPVMAEPLSGLRLDASEAGRSLAAGGFLAGDPDWLARHRPDVVLQIGATPTTRATQSLVASAGEVVILDADHPDPDPEGRATRKITQAPEAFAATAWDLFADARPSPPGGWADMWRSADLLARAAVDRLLDAWDEPFEGRIARDVAAFVPNGGGLFVGSSAPVRDLDAYMTPRRPPRVWTTADLVRFVANRGASGIDGSISTALGVAAAHPGTYALLGDLTFIYDAGALLWSARRGVDAVLVVIRNGGGEIFSLLPQRALPEHRDLFVTPHDLDLATICAAAGAPHERVEHAGDVQPALERAAHGAGVAVVEVVVDPDLNRARRDEVRDATRTALARTG